jgi:N-acetylglucosaminyl-diphospho-decaprenol L-rhamnosyltransferase
LNDPLATIIVVSHDSRRWLARQRAALESQTEQRFRLIVIDNASRAEERPATEELPAGARLIGNARNTGFAAANNQAAAEADTPYLVFLNPDAFPRDDWLVQLLSLVEGHPDAAAVGSTQLRAGTEHIFDGAGDVLHASGLAYRSSYGRRRPAPPPLGESFAVCAAAMLVRREAFEAVGGFDESFFCYFEDVDLCFRLRLLGWRILQSPDAVVAHVGGGSIGQRSPFADFHGARNRLWTFVKCMPAPLFWPLLPVHLAASALSAALNVLRGRGLAAWRGFGAGLAGLGGVWGARRVIQERRTASWFEIARVLAWSPHVFVGRRPVIRPLRATPPRAARVPIAG